MSIWGLGAIVFASFCLGIVLLYLFVAVLDCVMEFICED